MTLTNGGNAALAIDGIAVTGDDSGDFAIRAIPAAHPFPPSVPARSRDFHSDSITPPTRTAQVTVTDSGFGSPQVVDLTGTAGTAPIVTLVAWQFEL